MFEDNGAFIGYKISMRSSVWKSYLHLTYVLHNFFNSFALFFIILHVYNIFCIVLGTVVKYTPGLLLGGKLQHDCGTSRAIGYFLEPLLCLAPFCKKPLNITLHGVTNDNVDPSVSDVSLVVYKI